MNERNPNFGGFLYRAFLYELQSGKCAYCSCDVPFNDLHIDHFIPLSKGGSNEPINMFMSCKVCNWIKFNHLFKSVEHVSLYISLLKSARDRVGENPIRATLPHYGSSLLLPAFLRALFITTNGVEGCMDFQHPY